MRVLALIPARAGSKGIPDKNFKPLAGALSPVDFAIRCAEYADIERIIVSTDVPERVLSGRLSRGTIEVLHRPPELAKDDTPMIDVVKHALHEVPGEPSDIWVLLQPTQPLRTPAHVQQAIRLLRETQADSVVSVVELSRTHSPDAVCQIIYFPDGDERLRPWPYEDIDGECMRPWCDRPTRRQDGRAVFMQDGTVYVFYRRNLQCGQIYGDNDRVRPLIIPPEETCPLDTPADWAEAERRLCERA